MLLDQVTPEQVRAGQMLSGLTMVGLLGAGFFGRYAQRVRIGVAVIYLAGVGAFIAYSLL